MKALGKGNALRDNPERLVISPLLIDIDHGHE